jgi:hypothetical protein
MMANSALMARFTVVDQNRKVMLGSGWKPVVTVAEAEWNDGDCPQCGIDFSYCACPCPELEDFDYRTVDGVTYARPRCHA